MNENRKKLMLGLIGLVAVIVVGYQGYQISKGPGTATTWKTAAKTGPAPAAGGRMTPQQASAGGATVFQEAEVDIDRLLEDIEVVNFDYQIEHVQRDPMAPLVGIVRHQSEMAAQLPATPLDVLNKRVTGIIQDPASPAAVVDDEVVTIGFVYPDGTMVYEIERDRVVFRIGDSLVPVEMQKVGVR